MEQSKNTYGGKRPNAGRKPKYDCPDPTVAVRVPTGIRRAVMGLADWYSRNWKDMKKDELWLEIDGDWDELLGKKNDSSHFETFQNEISRIQSEVRENMATYDRLNTRGKKTIQELLALDLKRNETKK
jgi:hypothetical protein